MVNIYKKLCFFSYTKVKIACHFLCCFLAIYVVFSGCKIMMQFFFSSRFLIFCSNHRLWELVRTTVHPSFSIKSVFMGVYFTCYRWQHILERMWFICAHNFPR